MRALVNLMFILSLQMNAQQDNVPTIEEGQNFINYAVNISKLSQVEFYEYGEKAVKKFINSEGDDLLDIYRYAHALRYPETAFVAGTIVYPRENSTVNIPSSAKIIRQSEYTSMGSDWITYDLEDDAKNYYSITLNKNEYEVVSRFVNKYK